MNSVALEFHSPVSRVVSLGLGFAPDFKRDQGQSSANKNEGASAKTAVNSTRNNIGSAGYSTGTPTVAGFLSRKVQLATAQLPRHRGLSRGRSYNGGLLLSRGRRTGTCWKLNKATGSKSHRGILCDSVKHRALPAGATNSTS
jgi:hypothetical protein